MEHLARRQAGSVLVQAAMTLGIAAFLLVGLDLGYLFFMKRELQKTADLAALAAAPHVQASNCAPAQAVALEHVTHNLEGYTPTVVCGHWDPTYTAEKAFSAGDFNAVRVSFNATPPALLPLDMDRSIYVEAVTTIDPPVAAFTVGSRLLRLEAGSLLPSILGVLGVDLDDTDILSYQGLANALITPAGLLEALGIPVTTDLDVGTLNALADIQNLSLGTLLNASVTALQAQGSAADAQVALLTHLIAHLSADALNTQIPLFGNGDTPGVLLGLDSSGTSALDAEVDLLSLVGTALTVANGEHLVDLPDLSIPTLGVAARASVVEPPAVGIGGIGTVAHTAQIRLYLRAQTDEIPLVGGLLGLLGTGLDLPLILELVQSTGTLTAVDCQSERQNASIAVSSAPVALCIGRFQDMTSVSDSNNDHFFSENNRCVADGGNGVPDAPDGVRDHQILSVLDLFGLPIIPPARVALPLLSSQAPVNTGPLNEPSDPLDGTHQATVSAASLGVSQTVSSITDALLGEGLGDVLATLDPILDAIVQSLLDVLGLNLGETDVEVLSVSCGKARLVY
ncbi:hypothetical protein KIH07_05655 [Hydrogenophaga taeniospiralis]|uniref:pilus assembly protein TadG-related protein n=1 Tax=Hydrogenophaga taeniospiralis TaxID=65656 RepID=UPI001CF96C08|nr:pilus assembly protein TadG-related protein [Hydrogenophaga taeniospiralis]MCB4363210.1 hypothetical protein [Hydrogenophaga taeniospiralis]